MTELYLTTCTIALFFTRCYATLSQKHLSKYFCHTLWSQLRVRLFCYFTYLFNSREGFLAT